MPDHRFQVGDRVKTKSTGARGTVIKVERQSSNSGITVNSVPIDFVWADMDDGAKLSTTHYGLEPDDAVARLADLADD